MNPGRFFAPRIGANIGPMPISYYLPSRSGLGLFGKITNSLKAFNWGGLLNSANKTLNVVNQTIPLVRQAGPMFNNMKSMFRLAKMFGNETTSKRIVNTSRNVNTSQNNIVEENILETNIDDDNYPKFFV